MPVPLAIIVCEGDLQTIDHISQALQKNIPVIIMKGSGKAADLVLDFIRRFRFIINANFYICFRFLKSCCSSFEYRKKPYKEYGYLNVLFVCVCVLVERKFGRKRASYLAFSLIKKDMKIW